MADKVSVVDKEDMGALPDPAVITEMACLEAKETKGRAKVTGTLVGIMVQMGVVGGMALVVAGVAVAAVVVAQVAAVVLAVAAVGLLAKGLKLVGGRRFHRGKHRG